MIEKVVAYAKEQLSSEKITLVTKFIRFFYAPMALEDIQERSVPDLYGAVISQWELMLQRKPSEVKIHVFNPQYERDGWQSTHTITQLVIADMPFLVDSIRMEINRLGLTTHLMIHVGGIKVCRNKKYQIDDILAYHTEHHKEGMLEAPIHIEIDRQTDPKILANIQRNICRVLRDVRVAVEDWGLMQDRVHEAISELNPEKMLQKLDEIKETKAFLNWLIDGHFIFLGFRDYEVVGEGKEQVLRLIPNSGLGVLRDHAHSKMLRQY